MSTEVADLYVILRAQSDKFVKGMAEAGGAAEGTESKIAMMGATVGKMALATGAAVIGIGVASVKMASQFDASMNQLVTMAHVPKSSLKELSQGVLQIAGQVGWAPDSLAEALYHVASTFASTGISGKKMLDILKVGAEGAAVGHANLVDVMNALDAAVVSGIPGVENINQAMGALLATVGAGDMTMQNLADALGTGILAIGKQYGATLADIGAALATFGDNNIRGSEAATYLRMSIMDLTKQSNPGIEALQKIGIASGQLGKDLQTGGLNKAILDLHQHLDAAGITGTAVGRVLEDAFTKKSSAPLAILLGELGQFESKYPELKKGANGFGQAWVDTAATLQQKLKQAHGSIDSLFIGIGHTLEPYAKKAVDVFNGIFSWAEKHKKVIQEIGSVIKTFLVGALIIAGAYLASMAVEAAVAAAPFIVLALAIGTLAKYLVNLYEHNAKFRAFVDKLVTTLKKDAVEAIHWFMGAFREAEKVVGEVVRAIIGFYEKHKVAIDAMATKVKNGIVATAKFIGEAFQFIVKVVGDVIHDLIGFYQDHQATIDGMVADIGNVLQALWETFKAAFDAIKAVVGVAIRIIQDLWDRFGQHLWQHVVTAWNAIKQVIGGVLQFLKGIFEVITGVLTGNWGKAWKGIKDIFEGVWNAIVGGLKAFINQISEIIGLGMAVISALWDKVWSWIEKLAVKAWEGIKTVAGYIWDWFVKMPLKLLSLVAKANEWLFDAGKKIILGMLRGIGAVATTLWWWFATLPVKIVGFLLGLADDMFEIGKAIVLGIWHGVENLAGWLWDKVKGFCSSIWNHITSFFGISSPSKLMRDTVGKHIATGIAQGILDNQHQVASALEQVGAMTAGYRMRIGGIQAGAMTLGPGSIPGSASAPMVPGGSIPEGVLPAAASGAVQVFQFNIGGLIDNNNLFKLFQTAVQQHASRNSKNGLVFTR